MLTDFCLTFHQFKCALCFCMLVKTSSQQVTYCCSVTACPSICKNLRALCFCACFLVCVCECVCWLLILHWVSLNKLASLFCFERRQGVQRVQTECFLYAGSMLMVVCKVTGHQGAMLFNQDLFYYPIAGGLKCVKRESECMIVSFREGERSQDVQGCYQEPGFPW